MVVYVTRKRFDGLLSGAVRHSLAGRPMTSLTHEQVYGRMPDDRRARLLGTVSGGDDELTCSRWFVPGIGVRELIVKRAKLAEVIRSAEPWTPPEVRAQQARARARLTALRGCSAPAPAGSTQGRLL